MDIKTAITNLDQARLRAASAQTRYERAQAAAAETQSWADQDEEEQAEEALVAANEAVIGAEIAVEEAMMSDSQSVAPVQGSPRRVETTFSIPPPVPVKSPTALQAFEARRGAKASARSSPKPLSRKPVPSPVRTAAVVVPAIPPAVGAWTKISPLPASEQSVVSAPLPASEQSMRDPSPVRYESPEPEPLGITDAPDYAHVRKYRKLFINDLGLLIPRPIDPYFFELIAMYSEGAEKEGKPRPDELFLEYVQAADRFMNVESQEDFRARLAKALGDAVRSGPELAGYMTNPSVVNVPELPNSQVYANENHSGKTYLRLKLVTDMSILLPINLKAAILAAAQTLPEVVDGWVDPSWFVHSRTLIRDVRKAFDLKALPTWVKEFMWLEFSKLQVPFESIVSYTDGELILTPDVADKVALLSTLDPRIHISTIHLTKLRFNRPMPNPKSAPIVGYYRVTGNVLNPETQSFGPDVESIVGNTPIYNQVYRQVLLKSLPTEADRVGVTNELYFKVAEYLVVN